MPTKCDFGAVVTVDLLSEHSDDHKSAWDNASSSLKFEKHKVEKTVLPAPKNNRRSITRSHAAVLTTMFLKLITNVTALTNHLQSIVEDTAIINYHMSAIGDNLTYLLSALSDISKISEKDKKI